MSKRNATEMSQYINDRYKEYLASSFRFGSSAMQQLFLNELENVKLFKGPYLDMRLPFKRGMTINQMIEEKKLSFDFKRLSNVKFDRPLYIHQEQSIEKIKSGRNVVVTTGTGSGKTECFLYPIIDEILIDRKKGNHEAGVRAIFLYPMNALVNDQIERVRKLLYDCPQITYGFYTGDTPEKMSDKDRMSYQEECGMSIPKNELITREEIRKSPPDILFTNYSMLEYLMIRPNDESIIGKNSLNYFRFVVLDEAHTYSGAKGIEISWLLRRLSGFAEKKPQFILTSATLGEKGYSERQIIEFAQNLTSSKFETSDIIFSDRILLDFSKDYYVVKGNDYQEIKKNIRNLEYVKTIVARYTQIQSNSLEEILFDFLKRDFNVFTLYTELKKGPKTIEYFLDDSDLSLSSKDLSCLIDLINKAERMGIGLFELKYHSFVRPISGAYITLENPSRLTLTKTNRIGDYRAFEIGNCRYCNEMYIIGRIKRDETLGIDYLCQNDEIDIYENYGEANYLEVNYFLLQNVMNDEVNDKNLEEYKVCAKCGAIYQVNNLNARKCEHDDADFRSVYKVVSKSKGEGVVNNLSQCVSCGHSSAKVGIVKSFDLGKDAGTAMIGQFIMEAMDDGEEQKSFTTKRLSFRKRNLEIESDENPKRIKQFLAFSDSRQQASFFATFFDANHTKFLRRRIIWEVIKNNDYRNIPVNELASTLTNFIASRQLFKDEKNALDAQKNAWISILRDLLKCDGNYDSEGMGLYYYALNLHKIEEEIDEEDIKEEFQNQLTKKEFLDLLQLLFVVFQTGPAINYSKSSLTEEEKRDYLDYRSFDKSIMLNSGRVDKHVVSFLPKKGANKNLRLIEKILDCDDERAKEIISLCFNLIIEAEFLTQIGPGLYQIDVGNYTCRNYKTSKFYRCSKCGKITPYYVKGKCPQDRCDGTLKPIDPDEILKDNFYRQEYKNKKIENMVIVEHTAQLSRKQARQYQKNFANQKINILSCSTTFEMGVDIGDLEMVFMRNIPPTPANYVQRAGRAGRRKDSTAYVLTYCGLGSHDYTYFNDPKKMISGIIIPPYFDIGNDKIIKRHLMAISLGFFFKKYPETFKSINNLVFENGINRFYEYLDEKDSELLFYVDNKIFSESKFSKFHDFKWVDEIKNDKQMQILVTSLKTMDREYKTAEKEASKNENHGLAKLYHDFNEKMHKEKVLDMLANYCVIPKYGFPVDVVNLEVYENGTRNGNYDLNRDLKIAISEYAPESEVIVDKVKYTSHYISQPRTGQLKRYYLRRCPQCKKTNIFLTIESNTECRYCHHSLEESALEIYVEPSEGFKTGKTNKSALLKPIRSYAGEVTYLGGGEKYGENIEIGSLIMESTINDELLVMNRSEFYMCPKCGYSEKIKSAIRPQTIECKHKNYRQFECTNTQMEKIKIGHNFKTDVVRIVIPFLKNRDSEDYAKALSFLYALLGGISGSLEIERHDIDGLLDYNLQQNSFDIIVYDKVPGGAGQTRKMLSSTALLNALKNAYELVNHDCCDEDTSCYNCLKNYYNQKHHAKLKRRYAKEVIEEMIRTVESKRLF